MQFIWNYLPFSVKVISEIFLQVPPLEKLYLTDSLHFKTASRQIEVAIIAVYDTLIGCLLLLRRH